MLAAQDMQDQRTAVRDHNMKFMLFLMEPVMFNRPRGGPRVRLFVQHWLKVSIRSSLFVLLLKFSNFSVSLLQIFAHRWRDPVAVQGFVHHRSSHPSVRERAKVAIVLGHVERLIHYVGKLVAPVQLVEQF